MAKKLLATMAIIVLIVGLVSTLIAGDKCKDYFSTCTEGGCGKMITAVNCEMDCEYLGHIKGVPCSAAPIQ